jgi:hypothetical protein
VQQVYLWYIVVVQIESLLQRIVTNKRFILLILNNFVSQNLEVGLARAFAVTYQLAGCLCTASYSPRSRRRSFLAFGAAAGDPHRADRVRGRHRSGRAGMILPSEAERQPGEPVYIAGADPSSASPTPP